ncbi:hypothetical protein CC86DRAFT_448030, partial [Ophiobolus disseminans]
MSSIQPRQFSPFVKMIARRRRLGSRWAAESVAPVVYGYNFSSRRPLDGTSKLLFSTNTSFHPYPEL